MVKINEIDGNLISLALKGHFDVIIQGNNCLNAQGAGLAKDMVTHFQTHLFPMELIGKGDRSKLGKIDYQPFTLNNGKAHVSSVGDTISLFVVNCYSQYRYGANHADGDLKPIDYDALSKCMERINDTFSGLHIGIPKIGAGLAGGDWDVIKNIIFNKLTKVKEITFVYFKK